MAIATVEDVVVVIAMEVVVAGSALEVVVASATVENSHTRTEDLVALVVRASEDKVVAVAAVGGVGDVIGTGEEGVVARVAVQGV